MGLLWRIWLYMAMCDDIYAIVLNTKKEWIKVKLNKENVNLSKINWDRTEPLISHTIDGDGKKIFKLTQEISRLGGCINPGYRAYELYQLMLEDNKIIKEHSSNCIDCYFDDILGRYEEEVRKHGYRFKLPPRQTDKINDDILNRLNPENKNQIKNSY